MSASAMAPPRGEVALDDVVRELAALRDAPVVTEVRHAAERTLFNILAVAIGGARTSGVQRLAASGGPGDIPASPSPLAAAPTTAAHAALVTGFAGHYDDYDDTHLATVIHPAAACLGAAWAAGRARGTTGAHLLRAFALGCEAQLRLGNAVSPEHYDRGWHITGTCGVVGATVTAGLLAGLDEEQMWAALAMACTRVLGHREAFGTELKPFHAGQAAANAVRAVARAAEQKSWPRRGVADPLAALLVTLAPDTARPELLLDGWGRSWELCGNAIKPYPCGIVAHPGIDAALLVREELARRGTAPDQIETVTYRCHPLVPELMGRRDPVAGLEARFSAVHGVAVGIVRGAAGLAEFGDEAATDRDTAVMRDRISFEPDATIARDAAVLSVRLTGGETFTCSVDHARGSADRPLTDAELRAKADELLQEGAGPSSAALWSWVTALRADQLDPWTSLPTAEEGGA